MLIESTLDSAVRQTCEDSLDAALTKLLNVKKSVRGIITKNKPEKVATMQPEWEAASTEVKAIFTKVVAAIKHFG